MFVGANLPSRGFEGIPAMHSGERSYKLRVLNLVLSFLQNKEEAAVGLERTTA
jgi:hypothetical protein